MSGERLSKPAREALDRMRSRALRAAELCDFVLHHPCMSNLATASDAVDLVMQEADRFLAERREGGWVKPAKRKGAKR